MTRSRIVLKNLPKHVEENEIKTHVNSLLSSLGYHVSITDVNLKKFRTTGRSRRFCFVGLKTSADAEAAVRSLHATFFHTSKLKAELALAPNDPMLPRPWSAYTKRGLIARAAKRERGGGEDTTRSRAEEDAAAGDSARVMVTNLPYETSEEELQILASQFGEATKVEVIRSKNSSLGFGFISYSFPSHAVQAISKIDGSVYQGRILKAKGAQPKPTIRGDEDWDEDAKSSFKKIKARERAERAGHEETWNLFFVSGGAAIDAAATALESRKEDVIAGGEDDSMAARAALAETHVINETKKWMKSEGISIEAFEAKVLMKKGDEVPTSCERSKDSIIVKHLPHSTTLQELQSLFSRHGALSRCSIAPSRTVAIIQYVNEFKAQLAFTKLSFRRFKQTPIFLEWAPEGIFLASSEKKGDDDSRTTDAEVSVVPMITEAPVRGWEDEDSEADDNGGADEASVFVKNLNFDTSEIRLLEFFRKHCGADLVKVRLMLKHSPVIREGGGDRAEKLSMGFGFVTLKSSEKALDCVKRLQGVTLDDHELHLEISKRKSIQKRSPKISLRRHASSKDSSSRKTKTLIIKNLAFQSDKKDLLRLFSAFGTLTAVRVPKRADARSRGFAFLQFLSRDEAAAAMEALQHSHLYGRRMILEFAADDEAAVGDEAVTSR